MTYVHASVNESGPVPDQSHAVRALKRIATFAWLAIVLGLSMQCLVLLAKVASGGPVSSVRFLLDVTQGITWSVIVCSGVAMGTGLAKGRAAVMGSLGFLFAPLAMGIAKGTEKVLAALLDAVGHPAVLSLASISAIKAVEYGLLGWLLGRLSEKQVSRPALYLLAGATIGLVFGGTLTVLNYHVAMAKGEPLPLPKLLGMGINEVVFPIGCGLVIYIGQVITRHLPTVMPK